MNQKAYMHATFTFTWLAHGNFVILHASGKYSYQTPYFNLLSLASFFYKQIMGFFEMCKNISPFRRLPILYRDQNLFSSKKKKKKVTGFIVKLKPSHSSHSCLINTFTSFKRAFQNVAHYLRTWICSL